RPRATDEGPSPTRGGAHDARLDRKPNQAEVPLGVARGAGVMVSLSEGATVARPLGTVAARLIRMARSRGPPHQSIASNRLPTSYFCSCSLEKCSRHLSISSVISATCSAGFLLFHALNVLNVSPYETVDGASLRLNGPATPAIQPSLADQCGGLVRNRKRYQ